MPMQDVSDVLDDPDFNQIIQVTRTVKSVDDRGEVTQTSTTTDIIAVVAPITANELNRLADAERLSGGCTVYCRYPLFTGQGDYTADVINANGSQYVVISVDDWEAFGAGFVAAKCGLLNMRDNGSAS